MLLYHRVMSPNDADEMANSVDPDQTAPLGAVWSGSALFAQAYLSENLGSLRYASLLTNAPLLLIDRHLKKILYKKNWPSKLHCAPYALCVMLPIWVHGKPFATMFIHE